MIWFLVIVIGAYVYNYIIDKLFSSKNNLSISFPWLWEHILVKIVDHHFVITEKKMFIKLVGAFVTIFGAPSFCAKFYCYKNTDGANFWSIMFSTDGIDLYTLIAFCILCLTYILYIITNKKVIKNEELQESLLVNRLNKQIVGQIQRNVKSGKYLPDTFMEVSDIKDCFRCFLDPVTFYKKLYDQLCRLNFDYYRRRLTRKGKNSFNFNSTRIQRPKIDFDSTLLNASCAQQYIDEVVSTIDGHGNDGYFARRKFEKASTRLHYLNAQFSVLLADAGQGKTNFLCDLAANVILKRQIPAIFLNAFELNADSIENSISHSVFPSENFPLSKILKPISNYCLKINKPFIIIIDGLNENAKPGLFAENLKLLIAEIQRFSNIRLILSCRNEYYDIYFKSIEAAFDKNHYVISKNFYSHLNEDQRILLIDRYLKTFNISASFSKEVQKELSDNLLLLRIFSEAFSGKVLGNVYSLLYDEMYHTYFQKMTDRVIDTLHKEKGDHISKSTINSFFIHIISAMIEHKVFMGIDYSIIEESIPPHEQTLFVRFVDENLLLRRDIIVENTSLGNKELISFTYDNFRDYLFADYLTNNVSSTDFNIYKTLVDNFTQKGHTLKEGIEAFLFLLAKKKNDSACYNYIHTKEWFDASFIDYIWQIPEDFIKTEDIDDVKRLLCSHPRYLSHSLLYNGRWDCQKFQILNIHLLIQHLEQLTDIELKNFLLTCWKDLPEQKYYFDKKSKSEVEVLATQLHDIISKKQWESNSEAHNIMEFALYFASVSPIIQEEYLYYYSCTRNIQQLTAVQERCNSSNLKQLIKSYRP